jgi:hypothetical protein
MVPRENYFVVTAAILALAPLAATAKPRCIENQPPRTQSSGASKVLTIRAAVTVTVYGDSL